VSPVYLIWKLWCAPTSSLVSVPYIFSDHYFLADIAVKAESLIIRPIFLYITRSNN